MKHTLLLLLVFFAFGCNAQKIDFDNTQSDGVRKLVISYKEISDTVSFALEQWFVKKDLKESRINLKILDKIDIYKSNSLDIVFSNGDSLQLLCGYKASQGSGQGKFMGKTISLNFTQSYYPLEQSQLNKLCSCEVKSLIINSKDDKKIIVNIDKNIFSKTLEKSKEIIKKEIGY